MTGKIVETSVTYSPNDMKYYAFCSWDGPLSEDFVAAFLDAAHHAPHAVLMANRMMPGAPRRREMEIVGGKFANDRLLYGRDRIAVDVEPKIIELYLADGACAANALMQL